MTAHNAAIRRLPSGWLRWNAYCPAGDLNVTQGSREDAQQIADDHNDRHGIGTPDGDLLLSCQCYDPWSMEHAPDLCSYCKRLEEQELA